MYYTNYLIDFKKSIFQDISIDDLTIILKRDDLISKELSGNKARKALYLFDEKYKNITKIISHGSVQSNAMLSLSYYAKSFSKYFDYYVDHIPNNLRDNPIGNYKYALANGINIIEGTFNKISISEVKEDELFIKEGISTKKAYVGLKCLANEIIEYKKINKINKINIFLPSGTGTTALFLQKELHRLGDKVYTTNCVGSEEYLQKQFFELENDEKYFPIILSTIKKYSFGKLYKDLYDEYNYIIKNIDIEFDLLYDMKAFKCIQDNSHLFKNKFIYIHQGGIIGNESMLSRYT